MPTKITVIYDNVSFNSRLKTDWGFAALIEHRGTNLMFDTGGDGPTLLKNMEALDIEASQIQGVVLSHAHKDHTGGLVDFLKSGIQSQVYLHPAFPENFKREIARLTKVVITNPGMVIAEGIHTTGEMHNKISEQALLINTGRGTVIVNGCSHPGIVSVIELAKELLPAPVHLVMGGFHLKDHQQIEITEITQAFRRLGVEKVAPSHCTGDKAIKYFMKNYGVSFVSSGVGKIIYVA
jgi:7,8-dihydropterin-6-yl-methyl-4-(beta-D-ribofuranosyl)aminobenzene 5'-phosphate synthase